MASRKIALDWIKKVLADSEDIGEPAGGAPLAIVERPGRTSVNYRTADNRNAPPGGDDQPLCLSWQLMRAAVVRPGVPIPVTGPVAVCAAIYELPDEPKRGARMIIR
jgi:hypothetical protein